MVVILTVYKQAHCMPCNRERWEALVAILDFTPTHPRGTNCIVVEVYQYRGRCQ